jgi:hypothetical protein
VRTVDTVAAIQAFELVMGDMAFTGLDGRAIGLLVVNYLQTAGGLAVRA